MTIIADIAYKDVYTPLGVYWSGEWKVPEMALYAATTGRDRISLLGSSQFNSSEVYINKSLYYLAELILIDAGLEAEEYYIDSALDLIVIPYSYFSPQSHREALRKIVEACMGQAYCDREGIVKVVGPEYAEGAEIIYTITDDNYKNKDNPTNWNSLFNYIVVDTQPLTPKTLESVYEDTEDDDIDLDQEITRLIYFNKTPCINAVASVTGDAEILSASYYSWGASIIVNGTSSGTYRLQIDAQPLEISNRQRAVSFDNTSIIENGKLTYNFPGNTLIQTLSQAKAIADKILATYKDSRRDVTLDWRGNPDIKLGNKIKVIDQEEENEYIVISNNIEYDGTLKETTIGRKA